MTTATEKIAIDPGNWDYLFAPTSVLAIVSTVDEVGRPNAATFGSVQRLSHDPIEVSFVVTRGGDTFQNVVSTGEFVVNLVSFDDTLLEKSLITALPWKHEISEFDRAGLTALPGTILRPPRVAECYAHFEAKVSWTHSWRHRLFVVGDVVAVTADADCITGDQRLNWAQARPAHFAGGGYKDLFVLAYPPQRIDWDWRRLEGAGTTADDFRGSSADPNAPMRKGGASDWRDFSRSQPRT